MQCCESIVSLSEGILQRLHPALEQGIRVISRAKLSFGGIEVAEQLHFALAPGLHHLVHSHDGARLEAAVFNRVFALGLKELGLKLRVLRFELVNARLRLGARARFCVNGWGCPSLRGVLFGGVLCRHVLCSWG